MKRSEILNSKSRKTYNYTSRYSSAYYYYNKEDDKYIYGTIPSVSKENGCVIHNVSPGDTFDSLAQTYYGRPDLFWIVADFNGEIDPYMDIFTKYSTIAIPELSGLKFE